MSDTRNNLELVPCEIALTRGQVAIVDAKNFEWLNKHKWQAHWDEHTRSFRAYRTEQIGAGDAKKRITIWMHREVLGLKYGDPRKGDHIESGNTLLNTEANLRIANSSQNAQNKRMDRGTASGFKGVYLDQRTGKYLVRIMVDRKSRHLGYTKTAEEGHALYCAAATRLHGEFARFA